MVMLAVVIMGIAAVLVGSLSTTALKNEQRQRSAEAMAQAKDALIGYAITYGDTHAATNQVYGYLPCPDINGINGGVISEGSSETCGSKNVTSIGRLPWKTLDMPPLRDSASECLWYVVSGSFKNNPDSDLMNWDAVGQLKVKDANGNTVASDVVAVVFSPGIHINNQNRNPDEGAPLCGGNYNASNYLDSTAGINNATPSTIAKATSQFIAADAMLDINDQLVFITAQDIFNAVKRRSDFDTFVDTALLSTAAICLSALPDPVNINFDTMAEYNGTDKGSLIVGRIPSSALTSCPSPNRDFVKKWRDNLPYVTCEDGTACLTMNSANCRGVVIFSGEREVTQSRDDKNSWSNYLEEDRLVMFNTGATSVTSPVSGYNPTSPSTDIVRCIP
jgi:type II secretory pathway pseudopilin PulG